MEGLLQMFRETHGQSRVDDHQNFLDAAADNLERGQMTQRRKPSLVIITEKEIKGGQ